MTDSKFSYEKIVDPSRTAASGLIKHSGCLDIFMDIAAVHSAMMGAGYYDLAAEGRFWITAKTRAVFYKRPKMMDKVTVTTWSRPPEFAKSDRHYAISDGEEVLVAGKTLWAVINLGTGKLERADYVYPEGAVFDDDETVAEPYEKITDDFPEEPFGSYKVKSIDIDVGHHMNNVAYARAVESLFSTEEWETMDPRMIELQFKSQCREGDVLEFKKREEGKKLFLKAENAGKTALLAVIERK